MIIEFKKKKQKYFRIHIITHIFRQTTLHYLLPNSYEFVFSFHQTQNATFTSFSAHLGAAWGVCPRSCAPGVESWRHGSGAAVETYGAAPIRPSQPLLPPPQRLPLPHLDSCPASRHHLALQTPVRKQNSIFDSRWQILFPHMMRDDCWTMCGKFP